MAIEGGTFKLPSAKKNGRIVALATTIVIVGCIAASFTIRPSKLSIDANGETMIDHDGITAKSNIRSMSTKSKSMRFNPRLKPFGQHVLNGYNSCKDLERDVRAALKLLADTIIAQGKTNDCRFIPMYAEMAMEDSTVSKSDVKETSYGTNNQVDGVDEADIVKSDGTNIFLGYGDQVIVTDLEGNILTNATLPPPPKANLTGPQPMPYDTYYMPKMSIWRPPTPVTRTVQALLLHENIITAIATYNNWECASALCGGVTNAFIYQFNSDDSTLTLLTQLDINGGYCTGRTIGSAAHIATTATVDTWSFTSQLDRCNYEYNNMTAVQYEAAAYNIANATVAKFAKKIMDGLSWKETGGARACKHIMQISSLTNQNSRDTAQQARSTLFGQSILQNFVQLTSFDMADAALDANMISSISGSFTNAYNPQMYATEDRLVLANNGYYYKKLNDGTSTFSEYTYLMTFNLSGAEAIPNSVGQVAGYLDDQYSMDYYEGAFRIATTTSQKWGVISGRWEVLSDSSSQVYVLKEVGSQLVVQGSVKDLGKGETIRSVRFLGDKGYVVTFRQVDPLYVIDFASSPPEVISELKVTGFSDFMYPIKDGKYLLTVGNEADENGTLTGVKISVFNVTDPYSPFEASKYVVPFNNGWARSDSSWDPHAFRYLPQSEKLIIPLYISNWEHPEADFDGFVVYDIDLVTGIKPAGNVTHADSHAMQYFCWSESTLPPRNMVFDGNLITFKSHSILSTDLSTMEQNWELNLDAGRQKRDNCFKYLY
jgi:hypothetical protein